jgi:ABC-type transporter Mla MlaB component
VPAHAHPEPDVAVLVIRDPIALADVAGLCERLRRTLLAEDADEVVCDVSALTRIDAGTVDALARLQLTARRLGRRMRLRNAPPRLRELIAFFGLSDAVPLVQVVREPEHGEHAGGVEERVEPDDPAV